MMLKYRLGRAIGIFWNRAGAQSLAKMLHRVKLALVVRHGAIAPQRLSARLCLQFARRRRFALFGRRLLAELVQIIFQHAALRHVVGDPALTGLV